ncbi:hypothetical protein P4644_02955 [Priestia aryabhattai]|uniref:hypothetical protein n=1 Tax=Priestia aryabhattai TaxID=412384 RepID=UPI002E1D9DF2|nr:hypothetical protein [Priestia aryabhattai]
MAIDIAKIITLPDETGVNSVDNFIQDIQQEALSSHEGRVKFQFLRQSLRALSGVRKSDLPRGGNFYSQNLEIEVDGKSYTRPVKLIKDLSKQPVCELRINIIEFDWQARITFFPYPYEGQLYYFLCFSFRKRLDEEDLTDILKLDTYEVYQDVRVNPTKYIK